MALVLPRRRIAVLATFAVYTLLFGAGVNQPVAADAGFNFAVGDLVGHSNTAPTSLQFGPDDKLYVADRFGDIYIYEIVRNGQGDYAVSGTEVINSVASIQNHDDDGSVVALAGRQVTGLLVAGSAANPVLYVSSSDPRINDPGEALPLDTNSGVLTRLTQTIPGSWSNAQHIDLIRGFPRNEENHSVNGMQISTDGNTLYLAVGGNTNMGAPSFNFGYQWEYAWSAAIVSIDVPALDALPTLTDTVNGSQYKYDLPTLDDPTRPNAAPGVDNGDPWGGNNDNQGANMAIIEPGMPVALHSVGYRNAYDVLIRNDGRMFTIDNGPNTGWGGVPVNEGPAGNCDNSISEGGSTINDNLHYVRELSPGELYYAGHPHPLRGNPEDVYTSTLSTSAPFSQPPVPFSMANPVECDYRNPESGEDGSLANWPYSTNGLTEYTASNFGGGLQGAILAAGWDSSNIARVSLSFDGNDNPAVTASDVLFTTGGAALDVSALGDSDVFPGTVWVANLFQFGATGLIRVYEPVDFVPCNGGPTEDDDGDGFTNQDELDNGTDRCNAGSFPSDHDLDLVSDLNDADDDNDGIPDSSDVLAIDAANGKTTDLPADYIFDVAEAGFIGSPFTGLMNNGSSNYLDQFDPGNMTVIGAAGVFTIDAVSSGDALGAQNNQDYGFQFGANTCDSCYPFVAYTAMSAPLQSIATTITTESMGLFIGPGTQSDYLKLVVTGGSGGSGAVDVLLEQGDAVQSHTSYAVPGILSASIVELFLRVDPLALSVQPSYAIDGAPAVDLGAPIAIPAGWLSAPNALAVGIISTAGSTGSNFPATWTEVGIRAATLTDAGGWTTLTATTPDIRHENVYVELNGSFYLFGGRGLDPVNIYDPLTDSWTSGTPPPLEMHHMQAVAHDDLIYILGAMTGPYPNETPVSHVYIYDPHNDSWYQGIEIPVARRRGSGAVAVYNDKIYFAGGIQNGHTSGTVGWFDQYDPRNNSWTVMPVDMPHPRDHTSGAVFGNKMYVVNGRVTTTPDFAKDTVPQVDVYDFSAGSWTTLANNLSTPRAAAAVAVLGNELLVIGGESDATNDAHAEVEALDFATGAWRSLTSLPFPEDRHGTQAIVYGDQIYIAGGSGAQGGSPELDTQVRFAFTSCPLPTAGANDALNPSPASLDFGAVISGTSAAATVILSNPVGNSGPITITDAYVVGADAAVFAASLPTVVTLDPGQTTSVQVTFSPDSTADFGSASIPADGSAALVIKHSGRNSAVAIPLVGSGTSGGSEVAITGLAVSSNSPVVLGGASNFNASVASGTNISYSWDFGDGATASGGATISHTYAATGNYVVTVTASNSLGSASANTTMGVQAAGAFTLLINSGGPAYTDTGGRDWLADTGFIGGTVYATDIDIANTLDDTLYQSERYGDFSYDLAVPASGCYAVTLHFAEIWWGVVGGGGDGSRIFDVALEGNLLLGDFDIHALVGPASATTQVFEVMVSDGSLDIDFSTDVNNAKISAIELNSSGAVCGVSDDPVTGLALVTNSPVELGSSALFTSTISGGTNVSYEWDFGDGTMLGGDASISYLYAAAGTFTASVTASNPVSSATVSTSVEVQAVDSDGDGLSDWYESTVLGTDPNSVDSDGDGLVDGAGDTVTTTAYPGGIDVDGDNFVDGELDLGTDPAISNLGDMAPRHNPDNSIDAGDLLMLTRMVTGAATPSGLEMILGDINGDSSLDAADIVLLQRAVLNGNAP